MQRFTWLLMTIFLIIVNIILPFFLFVCLFYEMLFVEKIHKSVEIIQIPSKQCQKMKQIWKDLWEKNIYNNLITKFVY